MFNQLSNGLAQFAKMFAELPAGKKVAIATFGLLVLAGILVTSYFSGGEEYSLLYANLSQEDALSISEKLKERKIQYKLEHGGSAISVPVKDVYQLRLELAGEGLPSGGGVGFEIFDKTSFGMTEFVQKLNYRRALQGELQRTINSIGAVQSSRVHISIPTKSLFHEDKLKATASVVLKLKGNKKLSKQQVEGVTHLVASSVEGLSPPKSPWWIRAAVFLASPRTGTTRPQNFPTSRWITGRTTSPRWKNGSAPCLRRRLEPARRL